MRFAVSGERAWDPVGVSIVFCVESEGAMDWKAWMGSASKNSWATMKGLSSDSGVLLEVERRVFE